MSGPSLISDPIDPSVSGRAMSQTTRRGFVTHAAAGVAALSSGVLPTWAHAQGPARGLEQAKIVVGFPAGGVNDVLGRRLADKMRGQYANTVLVDNRAGAGGQLAVASMRDSPADGSVMMIVPASLLAIYPFTFSKLTYDPMRDVQPVALTGYFTHGFAVGPAVPESIKNFKDYLTWAKQNPGLANYGSPAAGSMPHLITALAAQMAGVPLVHVPYKGMVPGVQDMLGGQIGAMCGPFGDFLAHVKSGRARVLAISAKERSRFLPDVPTLAQQGIAITMREWVGMFMPAKVDAATVQRASAAVQRALTEPDVIRAMGEHGMEIEGASPEVVADMLRADTEEWRQVVKKVGFKADS